MLDFTKLQQFPAYNDVPITENELLSDSITEETWRLCEAYYRQLAALSSEVSIVSITAGELTLEQAADEVAKKSAKGLEKVLAYKELLKRIREIVEEE